MKKPLAHIVALVLPSMLLVAPATAWSQEEPRSVQEIAQIAGPSVVVVTTTNRDGEEADMGAGFFVDKNLIATNLHVIGEARPVWVKTRSGKRYDVVEVHASDRLLDLAIVRVDADAQIPALELAKHSLAVGQPVVAIGHALGHEDSVVSGHVAGDETIFGIATWQVGMTVEPGSSGGPLLDRQGQVHGVIAMKSTKKKAFGWAIKVDLLRKLLESPNPISMEQWKTVGEIDANRWEPTMGANWTQQRGRLKVHGAGKGFGGRSLLLRKDTPPALPFELAASVKLTDEKGAAGIAFHSDGKDKHYGFYPSGGKLRLTSFEGPSVYRWNIIREIATEHYRPGEWNEIKVRVEKNRIVGYVNGHDVLQVDGVRQPPGRIGLCKFRDTVADFKAFRFGKSIPTDHATEKEIAELTQQLAGLADRDRLLDIDLIGQSSNAAQRIQILERQAKDLESHADQLRKLGHDIHVASVCSDLADVIKDDDGKEVDLLRGALLISKLDNPELDVSEYIRRIDEMAQLVSDKFAEDMTSQERLNQLDDYLFAKMGFHGYRFDYYNKANSHIDRVIEDREGLPITLSVVYMSLAKRLGINVVGVGLPGHFVVRHEPTPHARETNESLPLIDVFERGKQMSRAQATTMVYGLTKRPPPDDAFAATAERDILIRMLMNLIDLGDDKGNSGELLGYLEALVTLAPDSAQWRGMRAVYRHKMGRKLAALDDLDWILEKKPVGMDLQQIRQMRHAFAQ